MNNFARNLENAVLDDQEISNEAIIDFRPQCKCNSYDHLRTNHSSCVLNKKNEKNLSVEERANILLIYNKRISERNDDYFKNFREENNNKINQNQRINRRDNSLHHSIIRTNYRNEHAENIYLNYNLNRKKNQQILKNKFFNIARLDNFITENVFGKYVQNDKNLPFYGRHIIPSRNIFCPHCEALVWSGEQSGGNKKKTEFSICCSKGNKLIK